MSETPDRLTELNEHLYEITYHERQIAEHLKAIEDGGLYTAAGFASFADFMQSDMVATSRASAYRWIRYGNVRELLRSFGYRDLESLTLTGANALASYPRELWTSIYAYGVGRYVVNGEKLTPERIAAIGDPMVEMIKTGGYVTGGDGEQRTAFDEAVKAKRQEWHILDKAKVYAYRKISISDVFDVTQELKPGVAYYVDIYELKEDERVEA